MVLVKIINRVYIALLLCSLMFNVFCNVPAYAFDIYNLGDNIIRHTHKGELLMDRRRYAEAAAEFQIALQFNQYSSLSAGLYNNLGLCYQHLKEWPLSMVSFQRAIRMQPNFAIYYRNLIDTYAKADNTLTAIEQMTRVTDRNPQDAEAWYILGMLHKKNGNNEQAMACLKQYQELQPNAPLAKAIKRASNAN